jgi:hypothetical protein
MRQSGDIDRGLSLVASLAETTHAYARQVELLGAKLVSSFAALDAFGPKADSTLATLQHFEAMAENLAADVQTLQREIRQHGVPGYAPNSGNDQNLTGVSERLGELADLLRARPSPGYAAAVVHERVETQTQTIPSSLTETPSTAGAGIDALVLRAAVAEAVKPIELRLRDMAQSASDIRRTVAYLAGLAETSHHVKTVARKFPRWWRN